jgi:hypothetical protein
MSTVTATENTHEPRINEMAPDFTAESTQGGSDETPKPVNHPCRQEPLDEATSTLPFFLLSILGGVY